MTGHPISWSLQITNLFWYTKYWGSLTAPKTSKLYCTRRWDLVLHRFTFLEPHTSGLHLLKKNNIGGILSLALHPSMASSTPNWGDSLLRQLSFPRKKVAACFPIPPLPKPSKINKTQQQQQPQNLMKSCNYVWLFLLNLPHHHSLHGKVYFAGRRREGFIVPLPLADEFFALLLDEPPGYPGLPRAPSRVRQYD